LARALIERETVDDVELAELFGGIEPWSRPGADDEALVPPTSITPRLVPVVDPVPVPVDAAPVTVRPAPAREGVFGRLTRRRRTVRPEATS
jgi:hypothetical protein